MSKVKENTDELLLQLVAWETLGKAELDPKALLREIELPDLCVVFQRIAQNYTSYESLHSDGFLTEQMILMELMYRTGNSPDWTLRMENGKSRIDPEPQNAVHFFARFGKRIP